MSDRPVLMNAGANVPGTGTPLLLPSYVTVQEFKIINHSAPTEIRQVVNASTDEEIRFWLTSARFPIDAMQFKGSKTLPFPGYIDEQGNPVADPPDHLLDTPAFPRMNLFVGGQELDSMTVPGAVQQAHARYTGWLMTNPQYLSTQDHPSIMTTTHIEDFKAGRVEFSFKDATEVETYHDLPVRHSGSLVLLEPLLLNPDVIHPAADPSLGPSVTTRPFAPGPGNRAFGIGRRW